jgi:hypothetical protein
MTNYMHDSVVAELEVAVKRITCTTQGPSLPLQAHGQEEQSVAFAFEVCDYPDAHIHASRTRRRRRGASLQIQRPHRLDLRAPGRGKAFRQERAPGVLVGRHLDARDADLLGGATCDMGCASEGTHSCTPGGRRTSIREPQDLYLLQDGAEGGGGGPSRSTHFRGRGEKECGEGGSAGEARHQLHRPVHLCPQRTPAPVVAQSSCVAPIPPAPSYQPVGTNRRIMAGKTPTKGGKTHLNANELLRCKFAGCRETRDPRAPCQ